MIKQIALFAVLSVGLSAADFTWVGLPYSTGGNLLQDESQVAGTGNVLQVGQYQVDNHKRVWFRGIITCSGGGINGNTIVFVLPVAFAPKNYTIVSIGTDNSGTNEFQINPNGEVLLRSSFACQPNVDFLTLEGINYSIE